MPRAEPERQSHLHGRRPPTSLWSPAGTTRSISTFEQPPRIAGRASWPFHHEGSQVSELLRVSELPTVSAQRRRTEAEGSMRDLVNDFAGTIFSARHDRTPSPPRFHAARAEDPRQATAQVSAARRERWGFEIQQELRDLLSRVTLPDPVAGFPLQGRFLPDGQRLPPNMEVHPYYLSTQSRLLELRRVTRDHFPDGPPSDRMLVVIHAPNVDDDVQVIIFDETETRMTGHRLYMDLFTCEALLDLIHRTDVVPRLDLNYLDWAPVNPARAMTPPNTGNQGVSESSIPGLRSRLVIQGDLDENGQVSCSICLDEKHVGENVTALPCNHFYCKECIEAWLQDHGTCPTCRNPVR